MLKEYLKRGLSLLLIALLVTTLAAPTDTVLAAGPARPTFKVAKRAKKSVTLKIDKTKNATGYQIFLANKKSGKYTQVAASRIRTVKLTKLKKDKVYYVKVRAFKTVGFHITYGKYSKVIKIDKYTKKSVDETPDETPIPTETPLPTETEQPEETPISDGDDLETPVPAESEAPAEV